MANKDELSRLIREKVDIEVPRIRDQAKADSRKHGLPEDLTLSVKRRLEKPLSALLSKAGLSLSKLEIREAYSPKNSYIIELSVVPVANSLIGAKIIAHDSARKEADSVAIAKINKLQSQAHNLRSKIALNHVTPEIEKEIDTFLSA